LFSGRDPLKTKGKVVGFVKTGKLVK